MRDASKKTAQRFFSESPLIRWILLVVIAAIFATVLYPGLLVKKHRYQIGDVAESDIKALEDFYIEDNHASEIHRRQSIENVPTVYDLDPKVLVNLVSRLTNGFNQFRSRYAPDPLDNGSAGKSPPSPLSAAQRPSETRAKAADGQPEPPNERLQSDRRLFEKLIGIDIDARTYSVIVANRFSKKIPELSAAILTDILENGVVADKARLLEASDRGVVLRNIQTQAETHLTSGLRRFYGLDQARTMVRIVGDPLLKGVAPDLLDVIVDLSRQSIQPNIRRNDQETARRRVAAAEQSQPILHLIKRGEMLVREGERVTPLQFRKLVAMDGLNHSRGLPLTGLGAVVLLMAVLVIHYHVRLGHPMASGKAGNKDLLFLTCTLAALMILVKISMTLPESWFLGLSLSRPLRPMGFGIPLAAGAMIVSLFMGREVALIFSTVLAIAAAMLLQGGLPTVIFFILSCTMASWWIADCRGRKAIIKTGAKLGLLNALLAAAIDLHLGVTTWSRLPFDVSTAFMGGIGAGIITTGISPLVEWVFGYTTDITLLELANLDRPIMRRLMIEAPGTYHHSVVVGSLVEAAAAQIGANPLLSKVCGYYHDIGKLKQPLYFIENQSNGINRHDKLAPSMSALILIAHVKNGVEIARKNKLGQVIIETIQQHHGTSLIRYFYTKARSAKGPDAVNIDDFRYPGPRPQTREAGLVMLADIVEAASRTLENPTPSRIQRLVRDLISNVFADGQLDHCELTLKDLDRIATSFNKILNGIHHHRIEYLDNPANIAGKARRGSTDRKSSAPLQIAK